VIQSEQITLARQLTESFRTKGQPLRDVSVPVSAIVALVRTTLETSRFFPPDLRPADLGDGALIERISAHRYRVHERHEGQSPYCCDYIFVTEDLAPRLRGIAVDGANRASDHQPVSVTLE